MRRMAFAAAFAASHAALAAEGRTWVVAQADPHADDAGPGNAGQPFKTISRAAELAQAGDVVRVHEGVYRERVAPARGGEPGKPIEYVVASGQTVVVTGADVWRPHWRNEPNHARVVSALLEHPEAGYFDQFTKPYLGREGRSLGQVVVDGQFLTEMPDRDSCFERRGTWWLDRMSQRLFLHPPEDVVLNDRPQVELTVRNRLFAPHQRGLGYITVRGFVFDRAANQFPLRFWVNDDPVNSHPQTGAVGTRSGHHWIIENNVVRHAASIGIDIGDEGGRDPEGAQPKPSLLGRHVVRGNHVHDCGSTGVMGLGAHESRIIGNVIERINRIGNTAPECGGIKVHDFVDGEISGNLVRDNDCAGIWLDHIYRGSRVSRNLVLNNEDMGIFVELGFGPVLVDYNIVGYTRGAGLYAHDASGITIANNLFFGNAHFGVYAHVISSRQVRRQDGSVHPVETSSVHVLNNLFLDNFRGDISLPPDSPRATNNRSDYNLFLTGTRAFWEGEQFLNFRLNTNGGLVEPTLPNGIDPSNLSLESWRRQTGWDLHSRSALIKSKRPPSFLRGAGPEPAAQLSVRALFFDMLEPELLASVRAPRVAGADADYLGRPCTSDTVQPGPWRDLASENLPLPLWPRP